jgi:hypothetical protein
VRAARTPSWSLWSGFALVPRLSLAGGLGSGTPTGGSGADTTLPPWNVFRTQAVIAGSARSTWAHCGSVPGLACQRNGARDRVRMGNGRLDFRSSWHCRAGRDVASPSRARVARRARPWRDARSRKSRWRMAEAADLWRLLVTNDSRRHCFPPRSNMAMKLAEAPCWPC